MPPASLRRVRRALFALLFAALVLASCGGGDDKENVQDLLDKGFSSSMKSADLKVDASIQALTSIIEPIMMIGVGLMVGVIIISMYLPMFRLLTLIK